MNQSQKSFIPSGSKIILVDDEETSLKAMELTLKSAGFSSIISCQDGRKILDIIESIECDLIVLDIIMPYILGTDLFIQIKKRFPEVPVIMISGIDDINTAVSCMKNGARDYILKPIEKERFISSVRYALEYKELIRENRALSKSILSENLSHPEFFENIITNNKNMQSIFKYIEAIAPTKHAVLITGETGSGKELIAKAIHQASGRQGEFVAINVAGLDDSVFSDTLFGHIKGSFTSAGADRKGLIETASGGTIFLDEIGDLSSISQVKLLRLLQEKEFFPIGSDVAKMSDAKVIAATCKNLEMLKTSNSFRADLFYRLKTHYINLPPLRNRKEDLKILIEFFIQKSAIELNKKIPSISSEVFQRLRQYSFPGNIRELESMVYDVFSRSVEDKLSFDDFNIIISNSSGNGEVEISTKKGDSSSYLEDQVVFFEQLPTIKQCTDLLIKEAMKRAQGIHSKAASSLGITRQALGQRLNKEKS